MKPIPSSEGISLVLADVDGTLVTHDKVLTERTKNAVQRLRERGIRFAITSGRPPRGMKMVNDALHLDTPIAGFNGGVFTEPDGKVISSRILSREAAETAIGIIRKHQLAVWVYTPDEWYIPDPNGSHVARETWTVKFEAKVYEAGKIAIATLPDRIKHVVQCTFDGRRVVIFSGGPADTDEAMLEEIRGIHAGGGFGSIIGRNSFQRKKEHAMRLLSQIMDLYAAAI